MRLSVELERAPRFDDFDYAAFLRSRGIDAVAAFPEEWALLDRDAGNDFVEALRDLRGWAVGNIERSLPEPESSLAAGMLLGRERGMPSGLEEDLRRTGTTHLLVVSGQNVALLLGTAVALLTSLIARRRAALLALVLLPGYVVIVGADPPVVRAAIMGVGITLAAITGRRTPGWIYLAYAMAAMLVLRPLLIEDVAFQLSASATAGVMLLAPPLGRWASERLTLGTGRTAAALIEAGAVALAAALAVLPVQAASFGTVSLVQVPANVVVAPLYEATLLVTVIAAFLSWFGPVADVVGAAGVFVPATFVAAVELLARVPAATIEVDLPLAVGAAWFAALGVATWLLSRRELAFTLEGSARSGAAATVALGAAAGGLWFAALAPPDDLASVTVLRCRAGAGSSGPGRRRGDPHRRRPARRLRGASRRARERLARARRGRAHARRHGPRWRAARGRATAARRRRARPRCRRTRHRRSAGVELAHEHRGAGAAGRDPRRCASQRQRSLARADGDDR